MNANSEAPSSQEGLGTLLSRLAGIISASHYSNGDRAALRRWSIGQPLPFAFYRLWLRHAGQELPGETQVESWMVLVWGLSTMGTDAHRPGRPFGRALAESSYSEARLERLLSSSEGPRIELFMSAVRFLAAKGDSFDWLDAAVFLLASDGSARERAHHRIAQTYFRHLPRE